MDFRPIKKDFRPMANPERAFQHPLAIGRWMKATSQSLSA